MVSSMNVIQACCSKPHCCSMPVYISNLRCVIGGHKCTCLVQVRKLLQFIHSNYTLLDHILLDCRGVIVRQRRASPMQTSTSIITSHCWMVLINTP